MPSQPSTPRRSVAFAAFFVVLAMGAFGIVFYLFDGASLVRDAISGFVPQKAAQTVTVPAAADSARLSLPDGMPEEFALRIWQEQVDSQSLIQRLAEGEVKELRLDRVKKNGDSADIEATVRFTDGGSAPGVLGLRRFGQSWYFASISARRAGKVSAVQTQLPSIADVDVPLLNTMIEQNRKSQSVVSEYLDGTVKRVLVGKVTPGVNASTIALEMNETHGNGYANLVVINEEVAGTKLWLIAKFSKVATPSAE